jgi:xylulokinase
MGKQPVRGYAMGYLLGFDLGTSSCKAVILDESLKIIASAGHEYSTFMVSDGGAEQPSGQWWESFCVSVKECIAGAGISASRIDAVGIDTMSSVVLPVDKSGKALRNGFLWMDRRAKSQSEAVERIAGPRLFDITRNRADPSDIAPKILWIKENEPDIYRQTWKFFHANGYLVYMLTGVHSQDDTENGLSLLADTKMGKWSDELIRDFGIEKDKLPDIYKSADIVGKVSAQAAAACGLAEGTPVIAGAMDVVASALGTGAIHEGDLYVAGGTVIALGLVRNSPKAHPLLHTHSHIRPGAYLSVAGVDFGGGTMRWFRNTLGLKDYKKIDEMAALAPPGNDGLIFLPYMVGQRCPLYNDNTTGVVFGMKPSHNMNSLTRMFMEGTAYAMRNIMELFRASGTIPVNAVMTGGVSNSPVWSQIVSDVLELPIEVPDCRDVACVGIAAAAGVAVGMFKNFEDALIGKIKRKKYEPNEDTFKVYQRGFDIFKKVLEKNLSLYDYVRGR